LQPPHKLYNIVAKSQEKQKIRSFPELPTSPLPGESLGDSQFSPLTITYEEQIPVSNSLYRTPFEIPHQLPARESGLFVNLLFSARWFNWCGTGLFAPEKITAK